MKFVLIAVSSLFVISSAFADDSLGKKIEFYSTDNEPRFGIQYANALYMMTFTINSDDLSQGKKVNTIFVKFVDKKTNSALSDMKQLMVPAAGPAGSSQAFGIMLQGPSRTDFIIQNLRDLVLVLTVHRQDTGLEDLYLDIGQYCVSKPTKFVNLDTGASGCP